MDLLKLFKHRKYFLPFAKQNQAEDFKSCWSFCFELKLLSGSKYSMPWVLCAFGNVYIWNIELIPLSSLIHQTEQSWIWHLFEQKPKAFRAIAPSSVVFQDSTLNWHWRWLFHNIFSQILFCIQIVTIFFSRICSPLTFIKVHMFQKMDTLKYALVLGKKMLIWCIVFFPSIQTQLHKIDQKTDHQWWRYHRRLLDYQSPYF